MVGPDIDEQAPIDPILEEYIHQQYGAVGRGKVQVLEHDPGKNFYRFKREELPIPNDAGLTTHEEEVFIDPRKSNAILRRIRSEYKGASRNVQTVELFEARDEVTTLTLERNTTEYKGLLGRSKTETNYSADYKIVEPSEREIGTMGIHSYSLGYRDSEIKEVDVNLYSNAFGSSEEPADIRFEFGQDGVTGYMLGVKGKVKVEYGKPLQIGSSSVVINKNGEQYDLEVSLADGLTSTLAFPSKVDLPSWFVHLNEPGDDWFNKEQQFPVRFGVRNFER